MKLKIYCPELGRELTFTRPGGLYLYVDINRKPGTLGRQMCEDGKFLGSTLSFFGESQEYFEELCTEWYREFLDNYRAMQQVPLSERRRRPYDWFGFPDHGSQWMRSK